MKPNIFLSASRNELVVGYTKEVSMNFLLNNSGDDSYMTTMVLYYPKNLHFKKVTAEVRSQNNCSASCRKKTVLKENTTLPPIHLLSKSWNKVGGGTVF